MNSVMVAALIVQQLIPAGPLVRGGLADVREPRTAVGVISTDLFAHPFQSRPDQHVASGAHERQAVVQLGTNFPLIRVAGVTASVQGGIMSRFRLQANDNDELSNDFMVALPFNYVNGRYEARVRLLHRSGHLGDETVLNTGLRRQEYTHEEADLLIARSFGAWRVYGGGTKIVRTDFPNDTHGFQAGADGLWKVASAWDVVAGIDWQRQTIMDDKSQFQATAGVQLRKPGGTAALQLQYSEGASPVGEFFQDRERYWGLTVRLSRPPGTGNPREGSGIW